jgi:hypothetical protein
MLPRLAAGRSAPPRRGIHTPNLQPGVATHSTLDGALIMLLEAIFWVVVLVVAALILDNIIR